MKNSILLIALSISALVGCRALEKGGNFMERIIQLEGSKPSHSSRAVEQLRYGGPSPDYNTYDKGVEYAIDGNFKKAQDQFSKISSTNPLYPSAIYSNKVIHDAISNENLREVIIQYFKADTYIHKKQFDLAILEFDKCIKLNPEYAKIYYRQGEVFALTNQRERAVANYNKAIELDPKDADVYSSRGRIYLANKKDALALRDFSKSIEISNNLDAYMNRSVMYIGKGKYSKAADDARMMIKINSNDPIAYNILGSIGVTLNNKAQACTNYKKACELGSCDIFYEKQESGYCY